MMNYEEARTALEEYRVRNGMSQVALSKELGKSKTLVSAFLNGTYNNPNAVIPRIEALLNYKREKSIAPIAPDFADTTITRSVMDTIKYCQLQGKIGCVYGDAGVGKTTSINQYCRENRLAVKITISPAFASVAGFNELLADKLEIKERVSRRIYKEAVERLSGSGMVVIIDEAQHLTAKTLDYIRCLCDESGAGIVLIGNEMVYKRIKSNSQAEFAQLYSRVGKPAHVLVNHIRIEDIRAIFEPYQVPDEAIEILHKIAGTYYGLRGAVNVYVNAIAAFGNVEAKSIAAMAKEMRIA